VPLDPLAEERVRDADPKRVALDPETDPLPKPEPEPGPADALGEHLAEPGFDPAATHRRHRFENRPGQPVRHSR
jgi:hypothetical protein